MCFVVSGFDFHIRDRCRYCQTEMSPTGAEGCPNRLPISLERLQRIPPLSELEGTKMDDELTITLGDHPGIEVPGYRPKEPA